MEVESQQIDGCLDHDHVDWKINYLTAHHCLLCGWNMLVCQQLNLFHRHGLLSAPETHEREEIVVNVTMNLTTKSLMLKRKSNVFSDLPAPQSLTTYQRRLMPCHELS